MLASDLGRLHARGVHIVPSIICPIDCFRAWQASGHIDEQDVDGILEWARKSSIPKHLQIRVSMNRTYYGLLDNVSAPHDYSGLHSAIDRIYRSWGDDRARASRIIYGVDDEDGKPALVVQGRPSRAYSVVTRHPIHGSLTTSSNYEHNINNYVPEFSTELDALIQASDTALGRPVQITFTGDENCKNLAVIRISDEVMSVDGRWQALADLFDRRAISEVQFLMGIEPDMLGYISRPQIDLNKTSSYVKGLPVSLGFASGQLIFRGVTLPPHSTAALVLLVNDMYPEDIHLLDKCSAAIGTAGGMTSHLAVVSRGMEKPALTDCGGRVNFATRTYEGRDGQSVAEFTNVAVDGSAGIAAFGNVELMPYWKRGAESEELIARVRTYLSQIPSSKFKQLPVQTQWHIALLKSRLREMGLSE